MKRSYLRNNPIWIFVLVVTAVATSVRLFLGSSQISDLSELDWRSATIEGFGPGATREQIEASRGPTTVSEKGYWFWSSPDLTLKKKGNQFSLTGHQLECQGRVFHCGHRFAHSEAFENLKEMTTKESIRRERGKEPEPDSQAAVQKAFGPGKLAEELDYLDGQGRMLTFVFDSHTKEFSIIKSNRRISSVTFTYMARNSPVPRRR